MKTLPELQGHFFQTIIKNNDELIPNVKQHGEMSAEERVTIYVDGYRLRLIEALQDSYPALHTLMGDEDFEQLCLDYIDSFPSTHFSIRYFGHRFSDYLIDHYQHESVGLLSEMANFEWALRNAFDAKDQVPIGLPDLSELGAEQWPNLTFELHPSLGIIDLAWNTPALWQAIEQEAEPRPPQQSEKIVSWVIWRPELETQFRSMSGREAVGFGLIKAGKNFAYLCEAMAELMLQKVSQEVSQKVSENNLEQTQEMIEPEMAAQEAAGYLARWIEEGLLVSFEC